MVRKKKNFLRGNKNLSSERLKTTTKNSNTLLKSKILRQFLECFQGFMMQNLQEFRKKSIRPPVFETVGAPAVMSM